MLQRKSDLGLRGSNNNGKGKGHLYRRGKKGTIYCRFVFGGTEYNFSTGSVDERVARERGWHKFLEVQGELPAGTTRPRRNVSPTIGEVCELYQARIQEFSSITDKAMRRNVQALRNFVEVIEPRAKNKENGWKALRTSILTRESVVEWRRALREAKGLPPDSSEDRIFNARLNAIFAQIKSVFSKQARIHLYKDLKFPEELKPFLAMQRLKEPKRKWTPLPTDTVAELQAKIETALLSPQEEGVEACPKALVIFELARYAAMRSGEIHAIRRHWFEEQADGDFCIQIRTRHAEDDAAKVAFRPKAQDGSVRVGADSVRWWMRLCGDPGPTDLLIGEGDWELCKRRLLAELRKHIDRRLPLHELRKQAGSEVATRDNSITAAAEFIRDSIPVAEQYYATLLKPVAPLARPIIRNWKGMEGSTKRNGE